MSWGCWFAVSTLGCLCLRWLAVPKGRFLWKSSSCRKISTLLNAQILSPFIISWLNRIGFSRGRMAPSFLPRFTLGQFFLLPRRSWINAGSFGALSTVWNPSTGPLVGKGRLVVPLRWYAFLVLHSRWYIFLKVLGFFRTIRFWVLAIGRFPSFEGNLLGCVVAQTHSLSKPYIPTISLIDKGVCDGLLQGLMPQMPHFR